MARIIKTSISDTSQKVPRVTETRYNIVGDKPLEKWDEYDPDELPFGEIKIRHSPQQFHNIFSSSTNKGTVTELTGLDRMYLRRQQDSAYREWASNSSDSDDADRAYNKYEDIGNFIDKANRFDNNYRGVPPSRSEKLEARRIRLEDRRLTGISLARSYNSLRKDHPEVLHPDTLFEHQPSENIVDEMFIHPHLKMSGPIALADANRNFGELTASNDLSEYSSRLTQHAQEIGLPVKGHRENPFAHQTNYIQDQEPTVYKSYADELAQPHKGVNVERRVLTSDEVKGAKEHLRKLTQGRKKANMSPQFDQPTLFD